MGSTVPTDSDALNKCCEYWPINSNGATLLNKKQLLVIFLSLCIASSTSHVGAYGSFDVVSFGAVGDGKTDDTNAFYKAWQAVCRASGDKPTLLIPQKKTFLIHSSTFSGPCVRFEIQIQVLGNIVAPSSVAWERCDIALLIFSEVNGLIIDGSGQIDGQGATWWKKVYKCDKRPRNVQFNNCNDLHVTGITSLNSPMMHICLRGCENVTISDVHISAPKDSPNTDGIDISTSTRVQISNSFIGTGDDCIAINGGSIGINITNITCGPGHGISIGSLGDNGPGDSVAEVHVKNCTFNGTLNGARIKTVVQGGSGYARSIYFNDIILKAAGNPIIIDQHYCNGQARGCLNQNSAIFISNITFSGFRGTSASVNAIVLDCSDQGCSGLILEDINMTSTDPNKQLQAYCHNAHGKVHYAMNPAVPCLLP